MASAVAISSSDPRCGTAWLEQLDSAGRSELLVALLSRFNHDLRTPLNTILGWTHLLQKGGLDTARETHVADVIARNSRDQTQLLEDFIDDGRTVLGALQLQTAAVQIDRPVTQAIERIGSVLTLHRVLLQSKLGTAGVSVNGDPRRLARLTYRLLAVIARHVLESTTIELETTVADGNCALSLTGSAHEPDWSDAALLDLRIGTLMAALHDGELQLGADSTRPCIQLRLPHL